MTTLRIELVYEETDGVSAPPRFRLFVNGVQLGGLTRLELLIGDHPMPHLVLEQTRVTGSPGVKELLGHLPLVMADQTDV